MQVQTIPLIIVSAYLIGMLVVGFLVSKLKIKNSKDYVVAGRRMGLFMVAFSLSANNIGGGCTTGLAQKAFGAWGMSACWYVLAASIAMIPLAYFAPKIRKTMAVPIPEVVGRRFGKFSRHFPAVLSVLSLFCLTSSQIAASGSVINALIPSIPLNVCLIFAGIVARIPTSIRSMFTQLKDGQINVISILIFVLFAVAIVVGVIMIQQGTRKIPVQYAKRVVGRKMYGGQSTHLPIKVALGGVMPIIFASSILSISSTIQMFTQPKEGFWKAFFDAFSTRGWLYAVLYFVLILAFAYFYTTIQYNPVEMANNLKQNNGTIPGIRPGRPTAAFIAKILSRITLIGALFLAVIALFPILYSDVTGLYGLSMGGTSVIIIVGVALDTAKQLESQMMMRHYKGFLD